MIILLLLLSFSLCFYNKHIISLNKNNLFYNNITSMCSHINRLKHYQIFIFKIKKQLSFEKRNLQLEPATVKEIVKALFQII